MSDARADLVIRSAKIYDGSGAEPFDADVAITGDRISAIGTITGRAAREIDARGLALSPGFIDVHSHDDFAVLLHPEMDFKTMQGVTTDIVGNCGVGAAPFDAAIAGFGASLFGRINLKWDGYPGYLDTIDKNPPSLNVGVLVGHGTMRFAAMRNDKRVPIAREFDAMRACLREALDAGAVGVSTGLIYEPGRYALTDEVVGLACEMAAAGGLYSTHMRNEAGGLLDSIRESIAIGEQACVPVEISHHKASGSENWGMVRESLRLIDEARSRGLDVTADQYPYTSGSTNLFAVVQNGALSDGKDELGQEGGIGIVPPEKILLASTPKHPEREGMTLKQVADELNIEPLAAAERVLAEESDGAWVVLESMTEADVRTVMRHPTTMIGSDGVPVGGKPHPRLYGTFPRVLGHYARELGMLTMHDAVHRMTGFPAQKFHLGNRGFVREGYFADLVLFDPLRIIDVGTYADPRRYPVGINHVFVNGTEVVRDGKHTGARPGRAIRRS